MQSEPSTFASLSFDPRGPKKRPTTAPSSRSERRHLTVFCIDAIVVYFVNCMLIGEAEREYQSKCAEVLDDQAPSTNVDHEEVISHQEAASNESIVEINVNEDMKQGN